jgi:hypothetical protein
LWDKRLTFFWWPMFLLAIGANKSALNVQHKTLKNVQHSSSPIFAHHVSYTVKLLPAAHALAKSFTLKHGSEEGHSNIHRPRRPVANARRSTGSNYVTSEEARD